MLYLISYISYLALLKAETPREEIVPEDEEDDEE